jgi:hypothetical protein
MKFRMTRSFVLFIVADIVVAALLVFVIMQTRQTKPVLTAPAATQAPSPGRAPVGPGGVKLVPVNNVDPATGDPVVYGSPVTMYKGHVIGFCCENSPAFRGGWDAMSEVDKDAFLLRWVDEIEG